MHTPIIIVSCSIHENMLEARYNLSGTRLVLKETGDSSLIDQ